MSLVHGTKRKVDEEEAEFSDAEIGSVTPCSPPALAISRVEFRQGHVIVSDGVGVIAAPHWNENGTVSPVCYTQQARIQLVATFRVTTPATHDVDIDLRVVSTIGGVAHTWTAMAVHLTGGSPSDVYVDLGNSDNDLPSAVGCFVGQQFAWSWKTSTGSWADLGTTTNTVYVVLANPTAPKLYLTALDIACRYAAGQTTAAGIVAAVFAPFLARNIRRVGDGAQLTYWCVGMHQNALDDVLKLTPPNGTCQTFAELLEAVYAAHGIGATIVEVKPHWAFVDQWCEAEMFIDTALPAHGNPAPDPRCKNHFIVQEPGGQFYDPSYGIGPYPDPAAWKAVAFHRTRIIAGSTLHFATAITVTGPLEISFPQPVRNLNIPPGSQIRHALKFWMEVGGDYDFFLPVDSTINGTAVTFTGVHHVQANDRVAIVSSSVGTAYPFHGVCDLMGNSRVVLTGGASLTVPANTSFRLSTEYAPGNQLSFSNGRTRQLIVTV